MGPADARRRTRPRIRMDYIESSDGTVVDEKCIFALKRIALLGGTEDFIVLSSRELGTLLQVSQQSASKRILELVDLGLITRQVGSRHQQIRITPAGTDLIRKEYNDYRRIFELTNHVVLHGEVSDGMGEGGYYIMQEGYVSQFEEKLGFSPYSGTLNVTVDKSDMDRLELLRHMDGITIDGFSDGKRTFGNVTAYKAKIRNAECAIVMPQRTSYSDVIEIICKYHLRRSLGLSTGDRVDVNIEFRDRVPGGSRPPGYGIGVSKDTSSRRRRSSSPAPGREDAWSSRIPCMGSSPFRDGASSP